MDICFDGQISEASSYIVLRIKKKKKKKNAQKSESEGEEEILRTNLAADFSALSFSTPESLFSSILKDVLFFPLENKKKRKKIISVQFH